MRRTLASFCLTEQLVMNYQETKVLNGKLMRSPIEQVRTYKHLGVYFQAPYLAVHISFIRQEVWANVSPWLF